MHALGPADEGGGARDDGRVGRAHGRQRGRVRAGHEPGVRLRVAHVAAGLHGGGGHRLGVGHIAPRLLWCLCMHKASQEVLFGQSNQVPSQNAIHGMSGRVQGGWL